MTTPRDPGLGRREGYFVPVDECQALEANGWRLVDDLAGDHAAGAVVLMAPPAEPLMSIQRGGKVR